MLQSFTQQILDALVRADKSRTELLDVNIAKSHLASYQTDAVLKQKCIKTEEVDATLEATLVDYYHLDMLAEVAHRGFYMLTTNLVAA